MREIRRVLFKKKYILPVLLLFIINVMLFQYSQMETLSIISSPESLETFVNELIYRQDKQHDDFYKKIEHISEEKERMLGISIFSDKNSFAYKNIIKTERDYGNISGVELSDINDYAVDCFLGYDAMYIIGFIIMMFTVITFLDERKIGLWQIVHSCSGGRLKLTAKRIIMLFLVSLVTQTVLVSGVLVTCFINYGGAGILSGPVQSVGRLQDFVLPVSLLWFIVYYVIFLSAALAVEGLFVWCVLSFIHNRNLGMIVCVCTYVAEYFLYKFILPGNPLSILKYTNIYFFINPREIFTEYTNFAFAGTLFNLREYTQIIIPVMAVMLCICVIAGGALVKPLYSPGLLEVCVGRIIGMCRKALCYFNGFGYEMYKMFIQKKGIIVFAVFLYIIVSYVDRTHLFLSPGRELLNEFYDGYTCEINEESLRAYREVEDKAEAAMAETAVANDNDADREGIKDAHVKMYEFLQEQYMRTRCLEDRGIKGWFINDRGYERLLGENGVFKRLIEGIIAVIAMVLMTVPLYISEYDTGAHIVISSTKKGKGIIFRRKTIYGLGCAFLTSVCMIAVQIYEVLLKYKFQGISAPVQNIGVFEDVRYKVSIGGFIALWCALRIFTMLMCSCITMLISAYAKKAGRAYIVSLMLMPLGIVNGSPDYPAKAPLLILAALPVIVCTVISVLCLVYTYKKWTNKMRG